MFRCMECGRRFRIKRAAWKASMEGCPGCGVVDIDLDDGRGPGAREDDSETDDDDPHPVPPSAA
jgi:hypothetical protein